jgi:hypothetical protein
MWYLRQHSKATLLLPSHGTAQPTHTINLDTFAHSVNILLERTLSHTHDTDFN